MLRSAGRGLLSRVANLQRCAAKHHQHQQQLVNLNRSPAPALSPSPRWVSTTSSVLSGHSGRGSFPMESRHVFLHYGDVSFLDECHDVLDVNPSLVYGDRDLGIEGICMCEETLADIIPRALALRGSLVDLSCFNSSRVHGDEVLAVGVERICM